MASALCKVTISQVNNQHSLIPWEDRNSRRVLGVLWEPPGEMWSSLGVKRSEVGALKNEELRTRGDSRRKGRLEMGRSRVCEGTSQGRTG